MLRLTLFATLVAIASVGHAEVLELEGVVTAVDADDRSVTIERKTTKGTKTLELEVAKKAGNLSSLKVGDRVSFAYDPDLEIVTKIGTSSGGAETPAATADSSPQKRVFGEREKAICREVCRRLENDHYLQRKIDAGLASQTLNAYLQALDPMKVYFLQSDIKSFEKARDDLPSQLREGDFSLAYTIFEQFLQRVDAVLPQIEEEIAAQHDFTKSDSIVTNRDATKWPKREDEVRDNWRRRIKYDLLVLKMQDVTGKEAQEQLLRRYRTFASRMRHMSSDDLMEIFLSALTTSVDAQSAYISPETLKNIEIGMRLQLDGIGALLKSEDGYTTVAELVPGGAAAHDGRLKPKDRIVGIGQGEGGRIVDVENMKLNDVVNLVRGKRGTVVRLKVLPTGAAAPKVYDIIRAKIELTSGEIRGEVLAVRRKGDSADRKIGVIRVPSFYADMEAMRKGAKDFKSATRDCKALLDGFRLQNVDAIVLDVRNNGGGQLWEVISMVGLFLDRGRVVQVKNKDGRIEQLDDKEEGVAWSGPLVVLVNTMTSGGAEIFAGAIQDHHRGVIIGDESTAGKTASMNVLPLNETEQWGSLKLLWQALYRPGGDGLQQRGVRSDVDLPSVMGRLEAQEGQQAGGLAFDRIPSAGFQPTGQAMDGTIRKLQKQSKSRVSASKDFQNLVKESERISQNSKEQEISLIEAEFAKQWSAAKATQRDPATTGDKSSNSVNRDFYLDEVLNIAADFTDEVGAR